MDMNKTIGGKTAEKCDPENEKLHHMMLQNATVMLTVPGVPMASKLEALSLCLGAYTDRGQA